MTIKQHGGIFGRNPTFNDVDVDGTLSVGGTALPTPSNIAKLDTAQEFTQEQEIKISDITAYDATAADAQVTVGPTLFLNNPTNSNTTVAGQVVFGLRSTPYYARIGATGGSIPKIFVGIGTSEIARFTSDGITFNGDTAAANALDDYEEGTWTPTLYFTSSDGDKSYVQQTGTYTKVGNLVNCQGFVRISETTASGNVRFGGFPFTPSSEFAGSFSPYGFVGITNGQITMRGESGQTYAELWNNTTARITASNTDSDCYFWFSFQFRV